MCLTHSEAKNNSKTSEFGAETGLLQGHARRLVAQALKSQNSSRKLSAKHFYREDGSAGGGEGGLLLQTSWRQILCSCTQATRFGKPHQNKCYYLFWQERTKVPRLNFVLQGSGLQHMELLNYYLIYGPRGAISLWRSGRAEGGDTPRPR